MKPTGVQMAVVTALVAFTTPGAAWNCFVQSSGVNRWFVSGDSGGFGGICQGLWDNLHQFSQCSTPSNTFCGDRDGGWRWEFTVGAGCNAGMVEATWWDATQNQFGAIDC